MNSGLAVVEGIKAGLCDCDHCRHLRRHQPHFRDLRLPEGKFIGRYDPVRGILEVPCGGGNKYMFDLAQMQMQMLTIAKGEQLLYNDCHE